MNVDRCKPVFLPVGAGLLERLGDVVAGRGRKALPVAGGGCLNPSGARDRAKAGIKVSGPDFAECAGAEPDQQIFS